MVNENYDYLRSLDELEALCQKLLLDGLPVGFDVETGYSGPDRVKGALNPHWDAQFICGFSVTNSSSEWSRYVPLAHDLGPNLPEYESWEIVKPVLEGLPIIAHNMGFEQRNVMSLDRKKRGPKIDINVGGDSMLMSYVLAKHPKHGLKDLVLREFDHDQPTLKSLFPGVSDAKLRCVRFNQLELTPETIRYVCEDARWTLALYERFLPMLRERATKTRIDMYQLELQILEILTEMENRGLAVDWDSLEQHFANSAMFKGEMEKAAKDALGAMVGEDVTDLNLGSAKQMRALLYEQAGLTTKRTTAGGELSTDAIALEALSRQHPAVKKVLEMREVANLSNRLKKWATEYRVAHDDRVHPSFNQVVVASGRFSANDPAVQQLPKGWWWSTSLTAIPKDQRSAYAASHTLGTEYWTGNFRDFLVAAPGHYLLTWDFSQVELRVLAGFSQEPTLLNAYANGEDVHSATAAMMLDIPLSEVGSEERQKGKTINFGLAYQMGAQLLGEQLAISTEEAEELFETYYSRLPKVREWVEGAKSTGMSNGYVETLFGRKIVLWDLFSDSFRVRAKGERLCVNAPIQGTAADLAKLAMITSKAVLTRAGLWGDKVLIVNNLHDSLTYEVHDSVDPNELRTLLIPALTFPNYAPLEGFPEVVVDWEIGQRWGSSTKWPVSAISVFENGIWVVEPEQEAVPLPDGGEGTPTPSQEDLDLIIEVQHTITQSQVQRLHQLNSENPGSRLAQLVTPQGNVKFRTGLGLTNRDHISLVLGGASVYESTLDIDTSTLTQGVTL